MKEASIAWYEVTKAIRKYGCYQEEKALSTLDELTRECVERIGFKYICMADTDKVKQDFKELYNALWKDTSIKTYMKKLHSLGGTDSRDKYSKGWDNAINEAVELAEKYFGVKIEECL